MAKKYVYFVGSICNWVTEGLVHIPVLGVHSSEKKAMRHFRSIVKDRESFTKLSVRIHHCRGDDSIRSTRLEEAYANYENGGQETVFIERWVIK